MIHRDHFNLTSVSERSGYIEQLFLAGNFAEMRRRPAHCGRVRLVLVV